MQRSWFAPLVVLGTLSFGRAAAAQPAPDTVSVTDRAEARRQFQQGVAAYTHGRWASALEAFQNAYRLAPHPSVRVNMANCYAHLNRPGEAIFHFEQFLAESPSAPEAQTAQVERQISDLRARVGELQLTVVPSDALGLAVTLDGQAVSLGRPAHVTPGHHVIEAIGEGYTTVRRELDVQAGQAQVLNLTLERRTPAPAVVAAVEAPAVAVPTPTVSVATPVVTVPPRVDAPAPRAPRHGPPPAVFYAVAGLTGAAAVGWITAGALAVSANADFDATVREIQGGASNVAELQARGRDEAARASQLATWSDVATGVTVAGAIASVVLFLKTDFHPTVTVGATASAGGAALSLRGSF